MKRFGNLYEKIYDMDNLIVAHKNAKKGKGWYKEVKMIDAEPEKYLTILQKQLINKTYHTSEYQTFIKREGNKDRLIYKLPYFPDRICQWAILQVIEPYLIRNLIDNTYSAIPERGIHYGMNKIRNDIQNDVKGCQYCLKIDARKYYPSIDHQILKDKYAKIFKDKDLLWLLNEIIDSTESGVPIGNYLSQYSGNFYFSSFDHWCKEEKHIKHYHRYMDDIVILHESKSFLHQLRKDIDCYFKSELKLTVKDNWQVFPTYIRGIDYLGYRFFMNYTLLRKSTCKNMKKKLIRIRNKVESGKMMNYSEWCSINSYNGWLKHCDSFRLQQKYVKPLIPYCEDYYMKNIRKEVG